MEGGFDVTGGDSQREQQHERDGQQLRLALAMRGGASMAVWIGGAVAEINRLRTAFPTDPAAEDAPADGDQPGDLPSGDPERDHPWAALAELAGYDSVDVDVLAGTSAGGLNGVLMAASVVYGMRFDAMRGTWVRLADLEAMARPVPKFWQPRPPSLLEGDAYFRGELARAITDHLPQGRTDGAGGGRMDLLLTATLLDPVAESHFDGRAEPITQQRRRATFRFRHRGEPGLPLSDFGADQDLPRTARQLAQAARTTSSFPMAFEPAEVVSSPRPTTGDDPNMYGLFSESGPGPEATDQRPAGTDRGRFRVIDGGVLDNIPVTAAIRSVADQTADRPTDRWLLYLNPEPDSPRESRGAVTSALPVAVTALSAKMGQESLLADIDALDEHNRSVERTHLRRRSLFAGLDATDPERRHAALAEQVERVRDEHALVRARLDAGPVHRLLTEPERTDDDPLLDPVGGDPLVAWSPETRTALREHLDERFAARARDEPESSFTGVHGLLSAVRECLAWAQDIERRAAPAERAEIGADKARLYRLSTLGGLLRAHADRYWITGARLEPITRVAELDDWIERVMCRVRRLQHRLPSPVSPILGSVLAAVESDADATGERFQRCLAELSTEMESIVDSSGDDAAPEATTGHVDAVAETWDVLHRIADRLALNACAGHDRQPHELGRTLLETAPSDQRSTVLHRLVVLTAPIDVGRAPGSHIKFLRVVSDARSPLPFTALRQDGEVATPDKVRGSGLGNFGAFLSAKWRANDWMWGRLDSAAGLVPLLIEPERILAHGAKNAPDGVADVIERVVTTPSRAELGDLDEGTARDWREFLRGRWDASAADVRAELRALFDAPDSEHPLTETRRAVTERLHWTIAAEELPFVESVAPGVDPAADDVPSESDPTRLREGVERYAVGRQRWRDLDERRLATVATRFVLLAHRASLPTGSGPLSLLTRFGATLLKPVLLVLTLAVVAPTRAALAGFVGATGVALTGFGEEFVRVPAGTVAAEAAERTADVPVESFTASAVVPPAQRAPEWAGFVQLASYGVAALVPALLALVCAGWFGWRIASRFAGNSGVRRWLLAAAVTAVLGLVGGLLPILGGELAPAGCTVAVMFAVHLATFGYRPGGRVLATGLTAAVLIAAMWVCAAFGFSPATWLVLGLVATAYAHVVLLGSVDVLPPRPRSTPQERRVVTG